MVSDVVDILCRRDGISEKEAEERIAEVQEMLDDCCYDPIEAEDIMLSELGLEMDYIFDLL